MGDSPTQSFLAEDEHQASRLARKDVVLHWQVNVNQRGRDGDRANQLLDGQILEFDTNRIFDLGEILTGNRDPFFRVFYQEVSATGKTGKILAELPCKQVIAGGIHPQIVLEKLSNGLFVGQIISVVGLPEQRRFLCFQPDLLPWPIIRHPPEIFGWQIREGLP